MISNCLINLIELCLGKIINNFKIIKFYISDAYLSTIFISINFMHRLCFCESPKEEYNPLIPKENIITKNNQRQYMGKLVYEVTDAELSITQAKDFILVVSGLTEHSVVYDPRLISVSSDQPNSLKFSFKARQATNKNSVPIKEKVITSAITISSKKLENINKRKF